MRGTKGLVDAETVLSFAPTLFLAAGRQAPIAPPWREPFHQAVTVNTITTLADYGTSPGHN